MAVAFTLQREWFDRVEAGEKRVEYRACSEFWEKRLSGLRKGEEVVFLCGQDVIRGTVLAVERVRRPDHVPEGIVPTAMCFAVHFSLSGPPE